MIEHVDIRSVPRGDAAQRFRRRLPRRLLLCDANPLDGGGETLGAYRLQQVVHRAHVECIQRPVIMSGHEDHRRRRGAFQRLKRGEAVEFGHVDVEKQEVGLEPVDRRHHLGAGRSLSHDLDRREMLQVLAQYGTRHRLVIGDQRSHAAAASASGTTNSTADPVGDDSMRSRPAEAP
jgi:hypothetical protein